MRFICLGYANEDKLKSLSPRELEALMDECFEYDDVLRKGGHFAGGEALDSPGSAATLRTKSGKVVVTDGPYTESKEQIGGILFLEAKDMAEAVALMSKHPGNQCGPWEIRPAADLTPVLRASEERRRAKAK